MTPSQAFENRLARSSDACTLIGKVFFSSSAGTAATSVVAFAPVNLGARATSLANVFSDYKIKRIGIKFQPAASSTISVAVGVLDDSSTLEGDAPSNIQDIIELRCSAVSLTSTTIPTELSWSPINSKLWYKTAAGATGSDVRLTVPGILYQAATAADQNAIEIDYEIVFRGAIDTGAL